MEINSFEQFLEQVKEGKFPILTVHITVEQYLQIQDALAYYFKTIPPVDEEQKQEFAKYLSLCKSKLAACGTFEFMEAQKPFSQKLQEFVSQHGEEGDSLLIVHGDTKNQRAHFNMFGNPQQSAMTFAALLDNKESDFKRFIFSLLGVYLAKNSDDLKQFMQGIKVAKQTPGVN